MLEIRLYRFHVRNLINIAQSLVMVDKGNLLTIGVCYKSPTAEDSELNELMDVIKKHPIIWF